MSRDKIISLLIAHRNKRSAELKRLFNNDDKTELLAHIREVVFGAEQLSNSLEFPRLIIRRLIESPEEFENSDLLLHIDQSMLHQEMASHLAAGGVLPTFMTKILGMNILDPTRIRKKRGRKPNTLRDDQIRQINEALMPLTKTQGERVGILSRALIMSPQAIETIISQS